jgi:hypothetical protein
MPPQFGDHRARLRTNPESNPFYCPTCLLRFFPDNSSMVDLKKNVIVDIIISVFWSREMVHSLSLFLRKKYY